MILYMVLEIHCLGGNKVLQLLIPSLVLNNSNHQKYETFLTNKRLRFLCCKFSFGTS